MPCSTMKAGIVIMKEMGTALTLGDLTFIRGDGLCFQLQLFSGQ